MMFASTALTVAIVKNACKKCYGGRIFDGDVTKHSTVHCRPYYMSVPWGQSNGSNVLVLINFHMIRIIVVDKSFTCALRVPQRL